MLQTLTNQFSSFAIRIVVDYYWLAFAMPNKTTNNTMTPTKKKSFYDKTFKYFSSIFIYLLWLMRHFISIYALSLIISLFIADKYSQQSIEHLTRKNQITAEKC